MIAPKSDAINEPDVLLRDNCGPKQRRFIRVDATIVCPPAVSFATRRNICDRRRAVDCTRFGRSVRGGVRPAFYQFQAGLGETGRADL